MQKFISDVLLALWFFLPAGLANVAPVFAAKLPFLRTFSFPLDFYATFRGKRILGDHKTIRGLLSGILLGILTVYLQIYLYEQVSLVRSFVTINYTSINPIVFGFLSAVGALGGDALKSFFKRQLGKPPGKSWFPFDQIDYVIGGGNNSNELVHPAHPTAIPHLIRTLVFHTPCSDFYRILAQAKGQAYVTGQKPKKGLSCDVY